MDNNMVVELPSILSSLPRLRHFSLNHNPLPWLPE